MDLSRGAPRSFPFVGATGGALLAVLVLSTSWSGTPTPPLPHLLDQPSPASPRLLLDPATWWMTAGNVTPFVATWVDPSPTCSLSPEWFHWSVLGGSAEGSLDPTGGANVSFAATSVTTGPTTVLVRSVATLECGGQTSAIVATAEANITVVVPVAIQNLSVGPDPIEPGGTASLTGSVVGGEPPYTLRIAWGDGTISSFNLSTAGPFSAPHAFPAGEYLPVLEVTDSVGLLARGSPGETVNVGASTVVGITANRTETDVGVPIGLNGTVLNPSLAEGTEWSCFGVPPDLRAEADPSTDFSCRFTQPGADGVSFEGLAVGQLDPVTTTLLIVVTPPPALVALPSNATAEVGQPTVVAFNISGGVPPFRFDWSGTGTPFHGSLSVATDGTVPILVDPTDAGSFNVVARLVDSDGLTASNDTMDLRVDPALNASIASAGTLTPTGENLSLTASVSSGDPPFLWLVTPASSPVSGSATEGSLGVAGSFLWSGTFRTEGGTTVNVIVVDAAGGLTNFTREFETVPFLRGDLSRTAGEDPAAGTFDLTLALSGGLPPFSAFVNASDGERWNRTVPTDGRVAWNFSAMAAGALDLQVTVIDAVGADLEWNETVDIVAPPVLPPPPTATPPSALATASTTAPLAAGVLLAVAGLAVGIWLYRRRRSRSPVVAPIDPVAVLRQIIEPADGADRATVELLAEEGGIPLDVVRSTIDRLVRDGSIRSETSPDGEEVMSWSARPPP